MCAGDAREGADDGDLAGLMAGMYETVLDFVRRVFVVSV